MVTRRSFLAAAAAAMPLSAKGRIDISRISVITDEIARSSQAAVDFAKQYGLRWVELRGVPGERAEYAYLDESRLRAEAKLLDENGLRVSFLNTSLMKVMIPGIQPPRWAKEDEAKREARMQSDKVKFERRLEDLRKGLRAAHILGVDKMRVFTGWRGPDPAAVMPRVAEILQEMAEIAAGEKVHLLIENEGACNVGTSAELAHIAKLVPSKWVGINWDPLNGVALKEVPFPEGYALLPKKRVWNVQIKGKSILEGPQKLDWKAIFEALVKDGYKGQVGLETHIFGDGQIQASHDSMKEILKIIHA
ncbi:MAG TPA: sugar phosphate isomerase/epimerase family protein [Bryobacteraceae bacterium]|nr:sugar phosphate isomerase/epimerase family protein [Bryobacteraceae bacterium]